MDPEERLFSRRGHVGFARQCVRMCVLGVVRYRHLCFVAQRGYRGGMYLTRKYELGGWIFMFDPDAICRNVAVSM